MHITNIKNMLQMEKDKSLYQSNIAWNIQSQRRRKEYTSIWFLITNK
jgi:hypothetical protein